MQNSVSECVRLQGDTASIAPFHPAELTDRLFRWLLNSNQIPFSIGTHETLEKGAVNYLVRRALRFRKSHSSPLPGRDFWQRLCLCEASPTELIL